MHEAAKFCHPFEGHFAADPFKDAALWKFSRPVAEVIAFRRKVLAKWTARARELSSQERALHKTLRPDVAGVISSKRVLVFRHMLREASVPECDALIKHFTSGFPLLGDFHISGVMPPSQRVASRSLDDLLADSRSVRDDLARHSRGTGDAELDAELWKQTSEEKEKEWLEGPVPLNT